MNKLEVRGVSKRFGDQQVLDDVSITMKEGELVCLLGISGAGKSTLFNIISGLMLPDKGQVLLDGEDITGKTGRISYMLQKDLLLPYRTIVDNAALPLLLQGVPKQEARKQASAHFADFGLEGTENKWPHQLSGGMRQRAALLRTYLFSQNVALLDEPFSALDHQTRLSVSADIHRIIRQEGKTSLLVTHDISEAISLSDRVVVFSHRPATVKHIHDLSALRHYSPMERRAQPEFQTLFHQLWKELDIHV